MTNVTFNDTVLPLGAPMLHGYYRKLAVVPGFRGILRRRDKPQS